ncbi:glycosyltransferase family 2 protein [Motilibacter deserti]|uniref:Glycosyltransferase n=1 Tax=Motilibacter deserti TaxID=2714956 RepID=A0ABX0H2J8_9ACTN|nr:glycosyltransferase family 2 protein [Motilibacter deserti]NHC16566.1 glycosyltransferase [Motilibacter deserti]
MRGSKAGKRVGAGTDDVRLPRITLVVPSYNQAGYLRAALASIVDQGYPDLELIVMDGGSTDGSVAVVEEHAAAISYWQSQPDGGQSAALAAGFARATGEVLGWLNSDDLLRPGALQAVGRAFADDPGLQWAYGDSLLVGADGEVLDVQPTVQVSSAELASLRVYLPQESTFFRRSLYERVGGVRTDLHFAMDYDLWLRFAEVAPPRHLPVVLGAFRLLPGQKSADVAGYQAEEDAAKARYAGPRVPADQLRSAARRLRARQIAARLRAQGLAASWRLPVKAVGTLTGSRPQINASRPMAVGVLVAWGGGALGVLAAAAAVFRRSRRR